MWISVETELPEIGVAVYVAGDYIPAGTGHPKAHRCRCAFKTGEHWESVEWRGGVATRWWWKEDDPNSQKEEDA